MVEWVVDYLVDCMLHETEDLQEMVEAEACWEAVLRECRSFKYTKIGYRVQTIESKSFYKKNAVFKKGVCKPT